jgi:diguanylate cyclase (GGDEF)-like protein
VFVCLGLLLRLRRSRGRRLLTVLDALATTGALLLISWLAVLGTALEAVVGQSPVEVVSFLLTPTLDVAVLALGVLTLARTTPGRTQGSIGLLVMSLLLLAVGDSLYLYLVATADADPEGPVRVIWCVGNGLLALAAITDVQSADDGVRPRRAGAVTGLLPYLPVGATLLVAAVVSDQSGLPDPIEHFGVLSLVLLLLVRQFVALRQNALLADEVTVRENQLHHRAFHDPLTGLANRAQFHHDLERALARHARDRTPIGLLFLDLDDFKTVNDTLGHATGDRLLVAVAERLRAATRASDTVARLGGDEFAVLLEPGDDPHHCAARIAALLAEPVVIDGETVRTGGSTGVVELGPDEPTPTEDELLTRADLAMYAIKHGRSTRA